MYVIVADYAYPGQSDFLTIDSEPFMTRYEAQKVADYTVDLFRGYYCYQIIKVGGRTYRDMEKRLGEDFHIAPKLP